MWDILLLSEEADKTDDETELDREELLETRLLEDESVEKIELESEELLDKTLLEEEIVEETEVETLEVEESVELRTVEELEDTDAAWYIFNLFEPPQYSPVLFLQTRLHPLTLGTELV